MTMSQAQAMKRYERKLAFLEHTFPAWSIRRRPDSWIAVRVCPPSPAQLKAGLLTFIKRPTLDALVAALSQQLLIAQTIAPAA